MLALRVESASTDVCDCGIGVMRVITQGTVNYLQVCPVLGLNSAHHKTGGSRTIRHFSEMAVVAIDMNHVAAGVAKPTGALGQKHVSDGAKVTANAAKLTCALSQKRASFFEEPQLMW